MGLGNDGKRTMNDQVLKVLEYVEKKELTNLLSQALQRKDQDIVEAVALVEYEIEKVEMSKNYAWNRRQNTDINNQHHYKVDIFTMVLDMKLHEFCDCFSEISIELLINMVALSPCYSFSEFDASKFVKLSMLYPKNFTKVEMRKLAQQLDFYYDVVKEDVHSNLNVNIDLSRVMMEIREHISYYLVYQLVKLSLVLSVATTTVENCFSAMKLEVAFEKLDRRYFLNDSLICAIEKEE
ncbi:uncharacterized protein LOC111896175 [Lactuca sativa]|uniref:uncharacterized protein LOC111896175 n=1 Tax=Lactuca sativa TaxID=4236 RepID=UPI000CD99781|nr:uncharacterized protein LOC111896175 [Lactuca sativa]